MIGAVSIFLFYYIFYVLLGDIQDRSKRYNYYTSSCVPPRIESTDIIYKGESLPLYEGEIQKILSKHHQFYISLDEELKKVFLYRLQKFMSTKTFIIKEEGFKEMPVLVSAAAIQLTFGLKKYLLDFYKFIVIHPKEYVGDEFFKVLAGNVEYNTITIAWNQFLKGNNDLTDGSNVGLHEMSHALYFQKMIIDAEYTPKFEKKYKYLLSECQEAYKTEVEGRKNLYSAYADTNLQEFWAESVEIFFERPVQLCNQYPSVYEAMKIVLNQDPTNNKTPILDKDSSLVERMSYFLIGKSMP